MNNKKRIKTAVTGVIGGPNKTGRHRRKWLDV